jgi:hypothetical protein
VDYNDLPTLTTGELMALSGLTRMQVQRLEEGGVIRPLRTGARGRGNSAVWSFAQALGGAYYRAFVDAGCHSSWAGAACVWTSSQPMGELMVAFQEGRVLLALLPTGEARLLPPSLDMTRPYRLKAAQLDLSKVYERLLRRMIGYSAAAYRPALTRLAAEVKGLAAGKAGLRERVAKRRKR